MSPRAAWRLERLGFETFDYVSGKVDWLAAGLPTVRTEPAPRRAIDVTDREPAKCSPETPAARLGPGLVIVLNQHGIVLGRVRPGDHPPGALADDVMEPGPATVRAHEPLDEILERMQRRGVAEIVVTTPQGRLLGVVRRP